MTPGTAQAVCGTLIFNQQYLPSCSGPDIPNNNVCLDAVTSDNSNWYKFHCYNGGTLGFLITPGSASDDYDWELMDVTGRAPSDVYTMNLMVSLNISGVTGATGCTPAGLLDVNCAGTTTSRFNRMPTLIAGHDYLLMVTNWSASGTGYGLSFSGTAVLVDPVAIPAITNVAVTNCAADQLKITFSEDILCSSITPTGSEFSITNGTNVISGIVSQCSSSSSVTELTINLQAPLLPGTHNLVVANGSDGNTFKNVCLRDLLPASIPFNVAAQPAQAITGVTFSGCAPNVFDVTFARPIRCASITSTGSEFSVTPGTPVITGAATVCTGSPAYTKVVRLTLQNPLPFGNYQLAINNGTDGNTLIDTCGIGLTAGYNFPLVIPQNTVAPIIQSVVFDECHPDKIVLNFDKVFSCASVSANGSEFSVTPGTHIISASATNCGSNSYCNQITLTLQNPLTAGNFNIVIGNGSDGNTISDTCYAFIAAAYSKAFVTTQAPLPAVSNVLFSGCAPKTFQVKLSKPVFCNTITASGSEFSITPGNPAIANVQFVCAPGGYTDIINVTLQDQLPYGNYQLVVSNGSDGGTLTDTCSAVMPAGYTFPLVIPQSTIAPVIQSVAFDECKPFQVKVAFDKPVRCASLSADGSDFNIAPGGLNVIAASAQCTNGYTYQATLTLSGNLPAGNFSVNIKNGSDGNTLSDTCFSFIPVNATRTFIASQAPRPVFDSVQFDKCTPSQVKIFYSHPLFCNSFSADGAQWTVTGPTPVTVVSAAGDPSTCGTGYSNWIIINFSAPINNFGTYVLHNLTAGGLTLTDTCYATQNPANTISFNVLGKPSATFNDQVKFGCVMDTLVLSHSGGSGINSWQWTFSDGTTASGQNVSHTFPVSTITATVKLIVSNGLCNDTLQRSYPLNNAFEPKFTIDPVDTVCRERPITFTNQSTGGNLQYLWQFGDNSTFAGVTPPPHSYANSNNYTISLILTNNYGCKDTATRQIFITPSPTVSFATLNTQYCAGDVVQLLGSVTGNISSYTWDNGNNLTFTDTNKVSFSYPNERSYTVTLLAHDRFCDDVSATASTQIYAIPVVNLGDDITLCPGLTMEIGVAARAGYTYLWSNGATISHIITAPVSNTYRLTVDNHTCKSFDEIFVHVLDNCLIKVAGAFTPNNDGLNDELKAINADLATNFLLRVYNRFGQLLYSSTNPRQGWDGRQKGQPAEGGTYIWQLNYVDPVSHKAVYQKGTSVLIR